MEISFANRRLQKTCESTQQLRRTHGPACAKKLQTRFTDLEAAESLEAMRSLPGGCHELDGERNGQLALQLPDGKRLVIEPSDEKPPTKEDGGLDWSAVNAIRILDVTDYHD